MGGDQKLLDLSLPYPRSCINCQKQTFLESPSAPTFFPLSKILKATEGKKEGEAGERQEEEFKKITTNKIDGYCSRKPKERNSARS